MTYWSTKMYPERTGLYRQAVVQGEPIRKKKRVFRPLSEVDIALLQLSERDVQNLRQRQEAAEQNIPPLSEKTKEVVRDETTRRRLERENSFRITWGRKGVFLRRINEEKVGVVVRKRRGTASRFNLEEGIMTMEEINGES